MSEKVELELEHARNLLRGLRYAEAVPGLAHSFEHLRRAVDDVENPSIFERLRRGWDEGFERGRARARGETIGDVAPYFDEETIPGADEEPSPRWDYLAKAIRTIERDMIGGDVASQRDADQLQAYVRDTYDALGISIRHEPSLYVAITTASLLVELANNGRETGKVDEEVVLAIARISQSFAASLIPYLPPEARR